MSEKRRRLTINFEKPREVKKAEKPEEPEVNSRSSEDLKKALLEAGGLWLTFPGQEPKFIPIPKPDGIEDRRTEIDENGELKHCPRCNQARGLDDFTNQPSSLDGKAGWCKECYREYKKIRRWGEEEAAKREAAKAERLAREEDKAAKKEEKELLSAVGLKRCSRCSEIKPLGKFPKSKYYESGIAAQCRQCASLRGQKHYRKYPEKGKARATVGNAIAKYGALPPSDFNCICGVRAEEFHHMSYAEEDALTLVPWCKNCHLQFHTEDPDLVRPADQERRSDD